ncbi:organic cation transporter protein isoform X1 [Procambarus clarkii]|uniref:organic cation transporter protein isoform X1 n=1 Tax=Procambarus clarkii TaxID=6728 RepID=UPI0037443CFE
MTITDFDSIFVHIGGFGRYQMVLFTVNCMMNSFLAFVYFGQIFMTLTPPHWCRAPPDLQGLNLTEEQLKDLTIPRDASSGKFLQCRIYDVDFPELLRSSMVWPNASRPTASWANTSWPSASWANASWPSASWANASWPTTSCTHGWTYDYSLYYPTITSQLDWVCEEDWRPAFCQSLFFVGSLVASPVLGWAADKFGRLPVIVITNMVGGVFGVASAFCTSFATFTAFRFIVGMTYDTHFMVMYILLLEYVSSEYRTIMANVPIMFFLTLAMCAMPWIAVGVADWSIFTIIMHAPQLICFFFIWLVPESARWLLAQGRIEETVKILTKAAKVNQKTLTQEVIKDFENFGKEQAKQDNKQVTVIDLLKTPKLRLRFLVLCVMWMVITVAYDGHMRNTEHIGSNMFITFTIAGFVELPADFLTMLAVERVGRRHTTVWTLIVSGLACFAIAAIPEDDTMSIMSMAVAGRFMITMAINVGQQYPVEVLPTVARGSGFGAIHTLGYIAAFASPYIVYLSKYGHYLPYVILGALTVVGGAVCTVLPETLNQSLPDTLEDGETFFSDQTFCYNPCSRTSSRGETMTTTNCARELELTCRENIAYTEDGEQNTSEKRACV